MLVLHLSREMSVAGVAEVTSEHANRIWRILNHYAEEARLAVDLSVFRKLGIDEFLLRKGHVYMRLFSDLGRRGPTTSSSHWPSFGRWTTRRRLWLI